LLAALQRCAALFAATGPTAQPGPSPQRPLGTPAVSEPRWQMWLLAAIVIAGTVLRFWGLGAMGLHREDEDTSALPVLHILADGSSRFPSGMYYARAIVQSYLMAASSWVFGLSEWSLRLPSALCGVLLIGLCYLLGRRFLQPVWNLAFTAVVAFLPSLILASQTARMYIFMLASLAGYALLILKWERTQKIGALLWAVIVMIVALQFHELAVFGAFVLFYPALLHGHTRQLWLACAAFAVVVAAYFGISEWVGMYYPQPGDGAAAAAAATPLMGPTAAGLVPPSSAWLLFTIAGAGALLAWLVARGARHVHQALLIAALTLAGFVCQALLRYHLALFALILAAVLAMRYSRTALVPLLLAGLASAGFAVVQVLRLKAAGIESVTNIAGVMLGWPSVWPYVRVADYSIVALVLCIVGIAVALWQLCKWRRIPDFWLLFVLWAWVPLILVGFFDWFPPPRYTTVALLPVLLTSVAVLQWLMSGATPAAGTRSSSLSAIAAVLATVAVVNPMALARSIDAGYSLHPDHVGAAQFVRSQHPGPNDLILAEDVIVQTYYLGHVDYWLLGDAAVANFVKVSDGETRDIYTQSRIIGNGAALQRLIDDPERGAIYIIGSGENQSDGRRHMRGESIHRLLTAGSLPVVFVGRDQLTKVWKIPARRTTD
jgi:4-amino-4-deoxy-L-arabinose transferase-like glycosyltransferase